MKHILRIILLLSVTCFLSSSLMAQECTEEAQDALDLCLSACEADCVAQAPADCVNPPVDLEELRAAIALECNCEEARNFGKYRSCVNKVLKPLRRFKLITAEIKAQIKEDNAACKKQIKERRRAEKGPKGPKDPKSE